MFCGFLGDDSSEESGDGSGDEDKRDLDAVLEDME